jgi:hypothetical protein
VAEFLVRICRETEKSADKPILVFSGHTHTVHEFRIEKAGSQDPSGFYFYIDDYSGKYFRMVEDAPSLLFRYGLLKARSPLLFTSDAFKNKRPRYREVVVRGLTLASLEMKNLERIQSSGDFTPGCRAVALKACNGQYVCAEEGGNKELMANRSRVGPWETFEIIDLGNGKVAFKACNGKFLRAELGDGGRIRADRSLIKDHESFLLVGRGADKIALRTFNGKYVCAEAGGGRELIANRDEIKEWETFALIEV